MADTRGLTGLSAREVEERIAAGKVNVNTELKTKSVRELVVENLCTVFNLINAVLAVLVLLTGSFKNLTFLGIVLLNTGIGVVQSLRSKRMVDKLTLLATKRAVAIRDGEPVELELDQIVLDDLVKLGRGDQIPADAVVVSGEAQVNESLLTGESDLIKKPVGAHLMSGSFIDSGLVYARVEHVGADNYVARINNEAKYVKKVNSEIMASLNAIVKFAGVFMVPVGAGLFLASASELMAKAGSSGSPLAWFASQALSGHMPSSAILSTVGALLGMIPQGLVLLTSSVLAIATVRLARRKVLVQQLYCIETLARVDVLCLDKTGTITSGRMEVAGVHPIAQATGAGEVPAGEHADTAAVDLALANIARATSEDANETCQALLAHYEGAGVPELELVRTVPFSSAKKWSGAAFDRGSYVMGAAQFVLPAPIFSEVEDTVAALADTCRVLVVAEVEGFDPEGGMVGEPRPLGFVTIRDEIRSSAPETIGYFREQGVELNVISGDDPRTVSSIARVVGIPGAGAYVDATTLDTPAKLDAAVDRYHVFGRVTPQQKRELVQALKRRGRTVAMTGDGVNDVLALKEADCSVAMAAGSDAARNVAEIVLVDNDFASMPAVVAEGRRSINNLQRSAALFLTKTLFSMALAAICIVWPPYPFEPIQMSLINFFCIGMPGFVLGLEPNRARVHGNFLVNVVRKALPASAAVVVAACLDMAVCSVAGQPDPVLSTMSLVTSCAAGVALIWRISQPFTPLRVALMAVICIGICGGILLFPDFFSIDELSLPMMLVTAAIAAVGVGAFLWLARVMDANEARMTRRASGFGRGVRVSLGRGGRKVSSTGSTARRLAERLARGAGKHREARQVRRAQRDARRAVVDGPGRASFAATRKTRKDAAPAAPRASTAAKAPQAAVRPAAPATPAPARAPERRVTQTASGIRVKMPRRKRPE